MSRRVLLILNPTARAGRAAREISAVRSQLENAGCRVSLQESAASGDATVIAAAAATTGAFDVIAAATSPPVAFSLALGCAMLFVSQRWCGQILAKAHLEPDAVVTELKAALLVVGSGATWLQAKGHLQLSRETLDAVAPDIALARRSGAPVGPVLRRLIRLRQTHLDAEATRKVREAGVKLSLPMGFAMLPALVFLVVIPIFAAITNPQIGIT